MTKEYDAYLFDWDGTLVRTLEVWLRIMRENLAKYDVTEVTDREIVAKTFGNFRQGSLAVGILPDIYDEYEAGVKVVARERAPMAPLYDEVLPMLQRLKGDGKKLALITSSIREVIDLAIAHHELAELFDIVIAGDEVTAQKPHPESILAVLKHLGVPAARALMLGDSEKDLIAARNAGVDSLLFYPSTHTTFYNLAELQSYGPSRTIASWREL